MRLAAEVFELFHQGRTVLCRFVILPHQVDHECRVGYDSVFIFECKNWQEKVGKNEIVVFAEKVKVCNAQRGFFVAKSFTSDAHAQAALDPRIELLMATELDPSAVLVPASFHLLHVGEVSVKMVFRRAGSVSTNAELTALNLEHATFTLDGQKIDLKRYIEDWATHVRDRRTNQFNSVTAGEGIHQLEFAEERVFEDGQADVDGFPIGKIDFGGAVKVEVNRPVVVSAFEVATRGRSITVQANTPGIRVKAEFVELLK